MAVDQLRNHGAPAQEMAVYKGLGQRDSGYVLPYYLY